MARRTTKAQPAPEPEELDDELTELDDIEEDEIEEEPEPEPAPKKRATRSRKAAPKPEPEPEPEEEDDDELEDVADDDELEDEEEAPAKGKRQPPKRRVIEFGTNWLAEHVNEKCGTSHSPYTLRALIRKMVKEKAFDRNVGEDRSRYEFSGPKDPKVLAIVKYVNAEKDKPKVDRSENLKKAREARAAKAAEKKNAKGAKTRSKAAVIEEDDDDDDDIEELD
jgi:hypothetical protein